MNSSSSSTLDLPFQNTGDQFDHAAKFNDELLQLPIFKCKRCHHFLKTPITFVPNIGNICGSCLMPTETFVVRNTELEELMKNFVILCCFNKNGCGVKLNYSNIFQHQTDCYFRDHCCPFKNYRSCLWKGPLHSLCEHVAVHPTVVQSIDNNSFKISIESDLEVEVMKFIVMKKNNFIFHGKYNEDRTKLYYKIYYLSVDSNSFLYVVKQKQSCATGNVDFVHNSRKIEKVYNEQFFNEFDYAETCYVDVQLSKEELEVSIVVTEENSIKDLIPDAALLALECAVCKHYMAAQIYQCSRGHSICCDCKPNMNGLCPTCRQSLYDTRNFSLEMLSENLSFPCVHQEQGCQAYNLPINHKIHADKCFYKLFVCPFFEDNKCVWEGLESSLIKHLQDSHQDVIFVSSFEILPQEFLNANPIFAMIAFDKVFQVTSKAEAENWSFKLISRSKLQFSCWVGKIYRKNEVTESIVSNEFEYYCRIYCQNE